MSTKYYREDDLLVIEFSRRRFKTAEKVGSFIIHYDSKREPVLLEILNASRLLRQASKAIPKEVKSKIFAVGA